MKNIFFLSVILIFLSSCMNKGSMNSTGNDLAAKNKAGLQAFYDKVINAHNPAMIDSFCTADFVEHSPFPGYPTTRDGLKKGFADYFAGFPDLHATVNFIVADSSKTVAEATFSGTNSGPFMGKPATNKKINYDVIDIVSIKDGKATDHWGYGDDMKMMTQMGMMPSDSAMAHDNMKMDEKKEMSEKMEKTEKKEKMEKKESMKKK